TVPSSYPTSSPGSNTFNGITYSPYTTGSCLNLEQIEAQLKAVAGYTNNIRLYGADCNQVENVLKAIVKNNLDIKVLLGVWTREGEARYQNEVSTIVKVLQNASYRSIVIGVTVGNEEVFHGQSCASVCKYVNSARAQLTSSGISGLPVSTVDVYKSWDTELINCSDIIYANIYPFFTAKYGDGSISTAVNGLFTELDVMKKKYSISKEIRISESGWATDGTGAVTFGPANIENQCEFLTQFQCQAKKHQYPYYIMEAYDAPWKGGESCEKHFGIFGADSKLKCKS
ncbi:glycoside hydrolase, partial [Neoconidiobolus thromboides FSU 785]